MTDGVKNKINNAILDIGFDRFNETSLNSDWVVEWSKEHIFDLIDRYANELTRDDTVVKIPDLIIQLDLKIESNLLEESDNLRTEIGQQIKRALQKSILENRRNTMPVTVYKAHVILEFIEFGQLSRPFSDTEWKDLKFVFAKELFTNHYLYDRFLEIIKNEDAFSRLYHLMELQTIGDILIKRTGEKNLIKWITAVSLLITINQEYFNRISIVDIYHQLFLDLSGKRPSSLLVLKSILSKILIPETLEIEKIKIPKDTPREILKEIRADTLEQLGTERRISYKDKFEEIQKTPEEGAYIGQAGLVLIASFLPAFLKNIRYVNGKGQLMNQKKVPILLHYLATGEKDVPEWKLTLPKLLAGLNPGQHCETKIKPDKKLDHHIVELLQSVISHWKELKKTSPEGLRNTFLTREGKLHYKNGYYYLYVQEQTVDILLSYVSWNYQTIKLDWMKQILFVEWKRES